MKAILMYSLIFMSSLFFSASACEINFTVDGQSKTSYVAGDELVLKIEVVLTHRACPIALKDTKFTYDGAKVLGATEWKEEKPGTFTRKIKLKVEDDKKAEIKLTATRTCDKEGGFGSIKLKKQS